MFSKTSVRELFEPTVHVRIQHQNVPKLIGPEDMVSESPAILNVKTRCNNINPFRWAR